MWNVEYLDTPSRKQKMCFLWKKSILNNNPTTTSNNNNHNTIMIIKMNAVRHFAPYLRRWISLTVLMAAAESDYFWFMARSAHRTQRADHKMEFTALFLVSPASLLSANHLQGWSRPAEKPLPAYTGQTEEEDHKGESEHYATHGHRTESPVLIVA